MLTFRTSCLRSVLWLLCGAALLSQLSEPARSDVRMPALFSNHMVLQRDQANSVWGWADAGEDVTVVLGQHTKNTQADQQGAWRVQLDPMPAGGPYEIRVEAKNQVTIEDVLVGEVWICSGQSNMQMAVNSSYGADLVKQTARLPNIRLITVPRVGTQDPQYDFDGTWEPCSPENVGSFSAAGFFFGQLLHAALDVPIGLIHDSWGGSSCEAWIRRDLLEADPEYKLLLERWEITERTYDAEKERENYEARLVQWKTKAAAARDAGQTVPARPRAPGNPLVGQHRPGNLYCGMLKPVIGYGIRGAIWYQGESNAPRAYQYRQMFPLMIQSWRDEWKQGDFPFYWVQLADYRQEVADPVESDWAELREAQTMTLHLPNTGQAVIVDLGEANDIHPRNKEDVGQRLARWALAQVHGLDIAYRSPEFKSMQRQGDKCVLTFDFVGNGLRPFDASDVRGFTIAGEDKQFFAATAKILGKDQIEVSSDNVADPVAVRYAWSDNPICNVRSYEGLPLTPFRTDDWPGKTIDTHQ